MDLQGLLVRWRRAARSVVLGMLFLHAAAVSLRAQPKSEVRQFRIDIDNKPAGTYRMDIHADQNGAQTMSLTAQYRVRSFAVFNYSYSYSGTESWQNDRLVRLESQSNDDGKKFRVDAAPDPNTGRLVVRANNVPSAVRADVWTTTYWHLPPAQFRGHGVPLLDCDTGKYLEGALRFVAVEAITVLDQQQNCSHWRLTGGENNLDIDLWYDAQERLVMQKSVESGHRGVLTLTSIQ